MGFYMFLFLNYLRDLRDLRDITLCGSFEAKKGTWQTATFLQQSS